MPAILEVGHLYCVVVPVSLYVNLTQLESFEEEKLNYENASISSSCQQAYSVASSLVISGGGSSPLWVGDPWAGGPGCYKKER